MKYPLSVHTGSGEVTLIGHNLTRIRCMVSGISHHSTAEVTLAIYPLIRSGVDRLLTKARIFFPRWSSVHTCTWSKSLQSNKS